jgi:hypothetical protein
MFHGSGFFCLFINLSYHTVRLCGTACRTIVEASVGKCLEGSNYV